MVGPQTIDELIKQANTLGAMQASSIWALVSVMLAVRIYFSEKHHAAYDRQWQDIRTKEAEGDIKIAEAVKGLSDVMVKQNEDIKEMKFILDERLPKGGQK